MSYPAHNLAVDHDSISPHKRAHIDALADNPALQDAITWLRTHTALSPARSRLARACSHSHGL